MGRMNLLNKVASVLNRALGGEAKRKPHEYVYLDPDALREHYQAMTGLDRAPVRVSSRTRAGAQLDLRFAGAGGETSTEYEAGRAHLFEALEPLLRERYSEMKAPEQGLRSFVWIKGGLTWVNVGKHLSHVLIAGEVHVVLACREEHFSPFFPFLCRNPELYKYPALPVEVFAYHSGVLAQEAADVHPASGRSLLLVPTAILARPADPAALEAELRKLNAGKLTRPLLRR
jgi:hypothetical protein